MVDMNGIDEFHRSTWRNSVKMGRNAIIGVILLLVLMAIFLL